MGTKDLGREEQGQLSCGPWRSAADLPRAPGARLVVAVVTEPGGKPATATMSSLMDDNGTVSIAPLGGVGGFPRGTTVYFGDQTDAGPDFKPYTRYCVTSSDRFPLFTVTARPRSTRPSPCGISCS